MEPLLLSEEMRWEVRRVAVAFRVSNWVQGGRSWCSGHDVESNPVRAVFDRDSRHVNMVAIHSGDIEASCWFDFKDGELRTDVGMVESDCLRSSAVLAHGLYRLGIDDEEVWRELNITLSNHEKLELRLSLPREFWPKTWLEEEVTNN